MAATNQYARLLREDWDKQGASALAQELYSILQAVAAIPATTAATATTTASAGAAAQQVFQGTVQSGTGSTYQVTLDTGETVSATQMLIDGGETIPAATVTPVFLLADGTYRIQVPVWA